MDVSLSRKRGIYMTTKADVVEKIKILLAIGGADRSDASDWLGITPQSFSTKLYRGSFTAAELLTLIEHLGGKAIVQGDDWEVKL